MNKLAKKLANLAFMYSPIWANYQEAYIRVQINGRTISVDVRTENNFSAYAADVPLAELQWREVKKLTKYLEERGGWSFLSL